MWDRELRGSERLTILGIVLSIIGFLIIAMSNSSSDTGFFFIFPFFIIGDAWGPFMVMMIAAISLLLLLFFLWPMRILSRDWDSRSQTDIPKYLRITSHCHYCNEPVPEHSTFCPSCGNPLRENSSDGYEPLF